MYLRLGTAGLTTFQAGWQGNFGLFQSGTKSGGTNVFKDAPYGGAAVDEGPPDAAWLASELAEWFLAHVSEFRYSLAVFASCKRHTALIGT